MARSITNNANPFGAVLYGNTALNATADTNIRNGATTIYQITVDNSNNGGAVTYLQCWNLAAPVVGTTQADLTFIVGAGLKKTFTLDFTGTTFDTALSMACTTTPHGAVNPSSAVTVYALLS